MNEYAASGLSLAEFPRRSGVNYLTISRARPTSVAASHPSYGSATINTRNADSDCSVGTSVVCVVFVGDAAASVQPARDEGRDVMLGLGMPPKAWLGA